MNSPLILKFIGRNFAQKKHWHLAMFILGSSHQLVSRPRLFRRWIALSNVWTTGASQLIMMQFLKCSHKLSFSSSHLVMMQLLNLLINFLFHPQCLSSSIQREWSEEAGGLRTRITKARTQSLELQFLGCQEKAKRTSFSKLCKPFSFSKSGCQLKKSVLSYLVSVMKMGSQRHWKIMGNFFYIVKWYSGSS